MPDPVPVYMPKATMATTVCVFVEWLAEDGSQVREGEPLYVLSTDKVEVEVPSPATGILRQGDVEPDVEYPVETRVGTIETDGGKG